MIFKGKQDREIYPRSVQVTEGCKTRHAYLQRLAGLCLIFCNQNMKKCDTDRIWRDDPKLAGLAGRADAAAKKQIHDEIHSHVKEVTSTILRLNDHRKSFSLALKSGRNVSEPQVREQKFLLLRAATFQLWLKSNRSEMVDLRDHVLEEMKRIEISDMDESDNDDCNKNTRRPAYKTSPLNPAGVPEVQIEADVPSLLPMKKRLSKWRTSRTTTEKSIFAPSHK